jgi:polyphenol oxidase
MKITMKFNEYYKKINIGFEHNTKGGVEFLTIPSFDEKIIHCFTTRKTGVSKGGFASLNFSFGREKNKKNILANFKIIADTMGINPNDIVLDNYGHTPNVLAVSDSHKGKGVYNNADLPVCDGLATKTKNLPLVTMHADCAAIFFYDSVNEAICVCHAGWRGTVEGIVKNAIDVMVNVLGSLKQNIKIGVGPCILPCCFEIKADLESVFLEKFGDFSCEYREGKIFGNLEKGILYTIFKQGIAPEMVTSARECTHCNDDTYFSYRRQGQIGGAMASVMMIK